MKALKERVPEGKGFSGTYWENGNTRTYKTVIVVMGDTADDTMDRAAGKWLTKWHKVNALCIDLVDGGSRDSGIHSWPIERIENAVKWLIDEKMMDSVGIMGISMQSVLALTAASLIPELSLVIAFAPADYVPWGFHQGPLGRYGKAEWPSGTSALSWRGKDLPYLPATVEGEEYWKLFLSEKKKHHEMHTSRFFEEAERRHKIPEDVFIPVENIRGRIVLIGAEDDSMWTSSAYIRRMHARLMKHGFKYPVDAFIYAYGTHLLVPERLLYSAFPVGGGLVQRMFRSGKKHSSACRAAREELEEKLARSISEW